MDVLCASSWPGNIRELENAIERAVAFTRQPFLTPEDRPPEVRERTVPHRLSDLAADDQSIFARTSTLGEITKSYIQ